MDKMKIKIIKGGIIKVITDEVGPENHASADEFVRFIARKMGGETTYAKRTDAVHETHDHSHSHEHQ